MSVKICYQQKYVIYSNCHCRSFNWPMHRIIWKSSKQFVKIRLKCWNVYLKRYERSAINQSTIRWVTWKPKKKKNPNEMNYLNHLPPSEEKSFLNLTISISMWCTMLFRLWCAMHRHNLLTITPVYKTWDWAYCSRNVNCTTTRIIHQTSKVGCKMGWARTNASPFHAAFDLISIAEYLDRSFYDSRNAHSSGRVTSPNGWKSLALFNVFKINRFTDKCWTPFSLHTEGLHCK